MSRRQQIEEEFKKPREQLKLELTYPHPRDSRIVLLGGELHVYVIDGDLDNPPQSMTGLKEQFFPKFDPRGTFLYSNNYVGCDQNATKAAWAQKGKIASERGTYIHRQVELWLNDLPCDTKAPEMQLFFRWYQQHADWQPLRTEMSLFLKNIKAAGQFDALFFCNGEYILVDWKVALIKRTGFCWCFRKEEIKLPGKNHVEACGRFGSHPLTEHIESSELNKYFVQLNLYRYVLKIRYGIDVSQMYLVALHSDLQEAETIRAPVWEEMAEGMLRCKAEALGVPFDTSD